MVFSWGIPIDNIVAYDILNPRRYGMKNAYGKKCCYCACWVEPEEGRCWRWEEAKRWIVACEDCYQEKKEERRKQK